MPASDPNAPHPQHRTEQPSDQRLGQRLARRFAQAGEYHSSGVFTVAPDRMSLQLAALQLPRASAWVLKVLQSAVASRAAHFTVRQGRRETSLAFTPTLRFPLGDLQQALEAPTVQEPRRSVAHLAVGLRAVGHHQTRAFRVVSRQAGGVEELWWDGLRYRHGPSGASGPGASPRVTPWRDPKGTCDLEITVEHPVGSQPQRCSTLVDEYRELSRFAIASPIPVLCDGRAMDTLTPPEQAGENPPTRIPLALRASGEELPPCLKLPQNLTLLTPDHARRYDRHTYLYYQTGLDEQPAFLSGLALTKVVLNDRPEWGALPRVLAHRQAHRDQPSRLFWVLDGAIVECEPELLPPRRCSFDLYLCADGLATDLSTLALRRQPEKDARRALGLGSVVPAIEQALASLEQNPACPSGGPRSGLLLLCSLLYRKVLPVAAALLAFQMARSRLLPTAVHTKTDLLEIRRDLTHLLKQAKTLTA